MFGWLIGIVLRGIGGGKCRADRDKRESVPAGDNCRSSCDVPSLGVNSFFPESWRYAVMITAAMVFLGVFFRPFLVVSGFAALAVASRMYQRHIRFPLGIELGVFGTVICAVLYGPIMGAVVGLVAYPVSIVYTKEEARYLPVALLGIVVAAFAGGAVGLGSWNIVALGVGVTVLYDVLTGGLYYFVYRAPIFGGIVFGVTHVWFNYVVFSWLGEWVLYILA